MRSFGVGWVLLLEEELEGLDALLDRSALCDFIEGLVLLLDIVFVLVVNMNVCTLYICKTFLLLDYDQNTLMWCQLTLKLALQGLADVVSDLQRKILVHDNVDLNIVLLSSVVCTALEFC